MISWLYAVSQRRFFCKACPNLAMKETTLAKMRYGETRLRLKSHDAHRQTVTRALTQEIKRIMLRNDSERRLLRFASLRSFIVARASFGARKTTKRRKPDVAVRIRQYVRYFCADCSIEAHGDILTKLPESRIGVHHHSKICEMRSYTKCIEHYVARINYII